MSLPLTHSRNMFPVRTYSFERISCSLVLIISITHFSFHVVLSNVSEKLNTEYLNMYLGINNGVLSSSVSQNSVTQHPKPKS